MQPSQLTFRSSVISTAVATALASTAHAAQVTGLTIMDVGSNTANAVGNYSPVLDGWSGAFHLSSVPINVMNYPSPSSTFGSINGDAGTGTILGGGAANATGSFSTGFVLSGSPFVPFTYGAHFNADITNGILSIESLELGGNYGNEIDFLLAPDNGTLEIFWTTPHANGTDFDVAFRWSHDITSAEDPSLRFTAFTAQWVLEGCATTAASGLCSNTSVVPLPTAAWLLSAGLAGLLVNARRRSRSVKRHVAGAT